MNFGGQDVGGKAPKAGHGLRLSLTFHATSSRMCLPACRVMFRSGVSMEEMEELSSRHSATVGAPPVLRALRAHLKKCAPKSTAARRVWRQALLPLTPFAHALTALPAQAGDGAARSARRLPHGGRGDGAGQRAHAATREAAAGGGTGGADPGHEGLLTRHVSRGSGPTQAAGSGHCASTVLLCLCKDDASQCASLLPLPGPMRSVQRDLALLVDLESLADVAAALVDEVSRLTGATGYGARRAQAADTPAGVRQPRTRLLRRVRETERARRSHVLARSAPLLCCVRRSPCHATRCTRPSRPAPSTTW